MNQPDRASFVAAVIDAYRTTPGALGQARASDLKLAHRLFDSGVPLKVVTAALALAATRRICRPEDSQPLEPVRSLHYFKPVIDELLNCDPEPFLLTYIEDRLQRILVTE